MLHANRLFYSAYNGALKGLISGQICPARAVGCREDPEKPVFLQVPGVQL